MDFIFIRPIRESDNKPVATLIRRAMKENHADEPNPPFYDPGLDQMFQTFQQPDSLYLVAELNGIVIGGGGIYYTTNLPAGYCHLGRLYVDPAYRERGAGQKLIDACLFTAESMGYKHVCLETPKEFGKALILYEQHGFERLTEPFGNSGNFNGDIWMLLDF